MKHLLLFLPIFALAACNSSPREAIVVTRSDTGTIPVVASVSDQRGNTYSEAVMTLPEAAGSIVNVRERNYPNGTRQEIILSGDRATRGENVIDVSIATAASREGEAGDLQIGKPSQSGIRNEILSRFPDVRMGIVTRSMRNAYGPFGLAIGKRADGGRCIFAWQWIEDVREVSQSQSGFSKFGSLLSRRSAPVSVRIRMCRGDQTVDQMAGLIEGLRLGDAASLDRVMTMDRRNVETASSSTTIVDARRPVADVAPLPESLEAAISSPVSQKALASPRPTHVATRSPAPSRPRAAARRRVVVSEQTVAPETVQPAASAAPSIPQQQLAPTTVAPSGPRYLAPVVGATPMGVSASNIPQINKQRLDTGLPAQAYRGPTAAQMQKADPTYGTAPPATR